MESIPYGDYFISTGSDITERKKSEELLLKNQYYLSKAQEIGKIGSWELDIQKNELIWTEQNYRNFGLPQSAALTYEVFLNCVYPDDRDFINGAWNNALKGKLYDIEHRIVVEGEVRWLREKARYYF